MKLVKQIYILCLCTISSAVLYSQLFKYEMENLKKIQTENDDRRQGKLVDYSLCKFIQPGNVMPHYTCPINETKRFILMNDDISISSGNIDLEANVLAISKSKNLRICVTGDSMVNQLFHSIECLISHFNSDIQRVVHNPFYSEKYRMRLPGSIELSFPKTGSVLSFHGIKGPCKPENYGKIWEKCHPGSTDVLIFNIGYLHCADVLESFSYTKGIKSKLNIKATTYMTEKIISNISKAFKNRKVLLYGQPAPELVNYPNAKGIKNQFARDKFFRHKSDRVILNLVGIEKSMAEKYNIHYIDSFNATKHFLNEKERIKWGKLFSLGRTDRVHFCLPGPVDFATDAVLEILGRKP